MMRRVMVRCIVVRSTVLFSMVHFAAVRSAVAIVVAVRVMPVFRIISAATVIVSSVAMIEVAMFAPSVGIAPAGPWAHAQEDAVVEVIRPVKALGRASVRPSFVVAELANGWFADFNDNLRVSLWRWCHQGQARKQCCRAE